MSNSAEVRIERLFAIFIGSGYLCFAILLVPSVLEQSHVLLWWWTPMAIVSVFAPAIVLLVSAVRRRRVVTQRAGRTCAFGFLLATLTWGLAWNGQVIDGDVWIVAIPGLPAMAAAIFMRARWAIAALMTVSVPAQLCNFFARGAMHGVYLVPSLLGISFSLIFVAAGIVAIRTGRVLDATRVSAQLEAADAAAIQARQAQKEHIDGLMHDWVLSTLLACARVGNTDAVRQQAVATLERLDSASVATNLDSVGVIAAATMLRTTVIGLDDTQKVDMVIDRNERNQTIPPDVLAVLDSALAESFRNSLLHAGSGVRRRVRLRFADNRVVMEVVDDGVGFALNAIPDHRMGVSVSIVARVRAVPGGSVDIESELGRGTKITVTWERQL